MAEVGSGSRFPNILGVVFRGVLIAMGALVGAFSPRAGQFFKDNARKLELDAKQVMHEGLAQDERATAQLNETKAKAKKTIAKAKEAQHKREVEMTAFKESIAESDAAITHEQREQAKFDIRSATEKQIRAYIQDRVKTVIQAANKKNQRAQEDIAEQHIGEYGKTVQVQTARDKAQITRDHARERLQIRDELKVLNAELQQLDLAEDTLANEMHRAHQIYVEQKVDNLLGRRDTQAATQTLQKHLAATRYHMAHDKRAHETTLAMWGHRHNAHIQALHHQCRVAEVQHTLASERADFAVRVYEEESIDSLERTRDFIEEKIKNRISSEVDAIEDGLPLQEISDSSYTFSELSTMHQELGELIAEKQVARHPVHKPIILLHDYSHPATSPQATQNASASTATKKPKN